MPYVITVHDLMRYFDRRHGAGLIHRPNRRDRLMLDLDYAGIRRAAAVITISEHSRRDVIEHLRIEPSNVFVVHNGIDHSVFRPVSRRLFDFPYLLFVGTEQPRKNLGALLEAFALVKRGDGSSFPRLKLVKVGDPGEPGAALRAATLATVRRLRLEDDVVFTGRVPDEDLAACYSGASCLVLPSLYEGFGFPPIEAMACGCPVVVSGAGALREIAGEAALVVDPADPQSLAEAIRRVLNGAGREMVELGLRHARRYSWERAARETVAVYDGVAARLGREVVEAPLAAAVGAPARAREGAAHHVS